MESAACCSFRLGLTVDHRIEYDDCDVHKNSNEGKNDDDNENEVTTDICMYCKYIHVRYKATRQKNLESAVKYIRSKFMEGRHHSEGRHVNKAAAHLIIVHKRLRGAFALLPY